MTSPVHPHGRGDWDLWLGLRAPNAVHPHGRGDWAGTVFPVIVGDGSPPRAWGLVFFINNFALSQRFTPTGVGTGALICSDAGAAAVHPHGRGDWSVPSSLSAFSSGSPPRAWGLEEVVESPVFSHRFTPTGVGTGRPLARSLPWMSVHPHGRGDWSLPGCPELPPGGSPPRAWGLGCR